MVITDSIEAAQRIDFCLLEAPSMCFPSVYDQFLYCSHVSYFKEDNPLFAGPSGDAPLFESTLCLKGCPVQFKES